MKTKEFKFKILPKNKIQQTKIKPLIKHIHISPVYNHSCWHKFKQYNSPQNIKIHNANKIKSNNPLDSHNQSRKNLYIE